MSKLRLSFSPRAIREHFEEDDEYPEFKNATKEQLIEIGEIALTDDDLYRTFHRVLVYAAMESGLLKDKSEGGMRYE